MLYFLLNVDVIIPWPTPLCSLHYRNRQLILDYTTYSNILTVVRLHCNKLEYTLLPEEEIPAQSTTLHSTEWKCNLTEQSGRACAYYGGNHTLLCRVLLHTLEAGSHSTTQCTTAQYWTDLELITLSTNSWVSCTLFHCNTLYLE